MTSLRAENLEKLRSAPFDVLIIGGGINGAVCAAALAARGVRTAVIDKGDFAGFTSQQSSNLVWGGIKYMETMEFALVRQLCLSRNELMRAYPSTVKEIRFLTTVAKGFRMPPFFLWLGAWLYWLIGGRFTATPKLYSREAIKSEERVIDVNQSTGGIEYSDAYLRDNDARFVFGFVRRAANEGAVVCNYVEAEGFEQDAAGDWNVALRDHESGDRFTAGAKVLVNAGGAYVDANNALIGEETPHHHVYSKGIHLVVDRVTPNRRVLAFFASDGRLFFVLPMGDKTCIGTTDTRVDQPETEVTDADRQFVLDNINARLDLAQPLGIDDIISERCGVRPLAVRKKDDQRRDFLQLSRRHAVDVDAKRKVVSIFGGKLTDCLNVGEEICSAVETLGVTLPRKAAHWYGEPDSDRRETFRSESMRTLDGVVPEPERARSLTDRWWRCHGLGAFEILRRVQSDPEAALVPIVDGADVVQAEVDWMVHAEHIVKLEDFLRRRTLLGQTHTRTELESSEALRSACRALFGSGWETRWAEYFAR